MIFFVLIMFGLFVMCIMYAGIHQIYNKRAFSHMNIAKSYLDKTKEELDSLFILEKIQSKQLATATVALSIVLGIITFLATFNIIIALGATVIGFILPRIALAMKKNKRKEMFESQLVTGIDIMANVLKAGGTPVQGIDVIYKEMEPPISQEFGIVLDDVMTRGYDLSEALDRLLKRMKSEELAIFIGATNLRLKEAGGSLAPIYDRIGETIRSRIEMFNKIQTIIAEGKMQALVIGLAPVGIGGILMLMDPEYMRPLYTTVLGQILIGFMVFLEVTGLWLVKKIISIDV